MTLAIVMIDDDLLDRARTAMQWAKPAGMNAIALELLGAVCASVGENAAATEYLKAALSGANLPRLTRGTPCH